MSKRNRIFLGILLVYAAGIALLLYSIVGDIDPRYRESAEESLVETANLLASLVEHDVRDGVIQTDTLDTVFRSVYARPLDAQIFDFRKTRIELRVTVTDSNGHVLYDSTHQHIDEDFSNWRDVRLAMQGHYGARTTSDIPNDKRTAVMYVGAPVRYQNRIIGVVSAGKPTQSFGQFVEAARHKTILVGVTSVAAVLLLAIIVSVWLANPFGMIADYVRYVTHHRPSLPRLGRRAMGAFGAAYDEMRDALAGRSYVEDYVQTLTHELKSPLSAIRGAAELLEEPLPEPDRQRFLANISRETQRIQEMVDRMLELAALEKSRGLHDTATIPIAALVEDIASSATPAASARSLRLRLDLPPDDGLSIPPRVEGDAFLLRRALSNLIDNAIDFAPPDSEISISLRVKPRTVSIEIRDSGPGIPDYAQDKVFEKFYSLPRPATRKKSTGLGLSFVREIADLHRGRVELKNRDGEQASGAIAVLSLPRLL